MYLEKNFTNSYFDEDGEKDFVNMSKLGRFMARVWLDSDKNIGEQHYDLRFFRDNSKVIFERAFIHSDGRTYVVMRTSDGKRFYCNDFEAFATLRKGQTAYFNKEEMDALSRNYLKYSLWMNWEDKEFGEDYVRYLISAKRDIYQGLKVDERKRKIAAIKSDARALIKELTMEICGDIFIYAIDNDWDKLTPAQQWFLFNHRVFIIDSVLRTIELNPREKNRQNAKEVKDKCAFKMYSLLSSIKNMPQGITLSLNSLKSQYGLVITDNEIAKYQQNMDGQKDFLEVIKDSPVPFESVMCAYGEQVGEIRGKDEPAPAVAQERF